MKRTLLILSAIALAFSFTSPAMAAKGDKKGKGAGKLMKTYDTNANGMIDGDEIAAVKKAFDSGDAEVKALDRDADGKLSDEEIAAVKKHGKKKNK